MRKTKYQEGDWFAVPLEQGGYSLGLVARTSKTPTTLGYFFGPRLLSLPSPEDVIGLKSTDAVLIRMFGDLGIVRGEWPVLFSSPSWQRDEWPLPGFGHIDMLDKQEAYLREYNEQNLNQLIADTPIIPEIARTLPEDALSGHIALIVELSNMLPFRL